MRRTIGGCYDIDGIEVRRVADGPTENVALARWRERQADLWAESSTVAHVHRHLTAEESGLWHGMWKELQAVNAAIAGLEGNPPDPS